MATSKSSDVRPIRAARRAADEEKATRVVTAQLRMTEHSLRRLLSVSGSNTDFILSSADGSTTIRVELAVASVPEGELALGRGGLVLDWTRSTLSHANQRVSLTRMELRLLAALLEHTPGTAPRRELIKRMWPRAKATEADAALPVWVFALRRRFAALGVEDAIRTVRAEGYCLELPQD